MAPHNTLCTIPYQYRKHLSKSKNNFHLHYVQAKELNNVLNASTTHQTHTQSIVHFENFIFSSSSLQKNKNIINSNRSANKRKRECIYTIQSICMHTFSHATLKNMQRPRH